MTSEAQGQPGASCGPVEDVEALVRETVAASADIVLDPLLPAVLHGALLGRLASALSALAAREREGANHLRECMGHMPVVPKGLPEYEQRWDDWTAFRRAHEFLARRSKP